MGRFTAQATCERLGRKARSEKAAYYTGKYGAGGFFQGYRIISEYLFDFSTA